MASPVYSPSPVGSVPGASTPGGAGGGTPPSAGSVTAKSQEYDGNYVSVAGALSVDPRLAAEFLNLKRHVSFPVPGDITPSRGVPPAGYPGLRPDAETGAPNAWKDRPAQMMSPAMLWGSSPQQKPLAMPPWRKVFIPPLALYNDASQWVNRLKFVRPIVWFGADTSNPPLKAQYFSPPPLITNNLAGGTLNLQLQLGNIAIQSQQLTISASNYFGG